MSTTRWPFSSSLVLGALPTAVGCARVHARTIMFEWGIAEIAETVELVVSELVTNAVRASTGPDGQPRYEDAVAGLPILYLRLLSDRVRVVIEVWDRCAGMPTAKRGQPDDESGRGLVLVEALCERWRCDVVSGWDGKVVWAELRAS